MPFFYPVKLNMTRGSLHDLPEPLAAATARGHVALLLRAFTGDVTDQAIARYREIDPPIAAIVPTFQGIIDEIELAYVAGLRFSAISAACVSIERLLNFVRAALQPFHLPIKSLYGKGALNSWHPNIDALEGWGYLDGLLATELRGLYDDVRNRYLHSGDIASMQCDAKRAVVAAYRSITAFLGFPRDLFAIGPGIECLNPQDPRFLAFYKPHLLER